MYGYCWYNSFPSDESAVEHFNLDFIRIERYQDKRYGANTCFGLYGEYYPDKDSERDFYFALGAKSEQIEKFVENFNSQFKNISLRIVRKIKYVRVRDPYSGDMDYEENHFNELLTGNPNLAGRVDEEKNSFVYLLNIQFSESYCDFAKYVMRIPLGFMIRVYGCYNSISRNNTDNPDFKSDDYILSAIQFNKDHPDWCASLVSNYMVSKETFMRFDNPEFMNFCFEKEIKTVPYTGSYSKLVYGSSVKPYCVYYTMDNQLPYYLHSKKEN